MEFEIPNSKNQNRRYILNLIHTPGHIDFSYEISRALACVEGAILLVDATKGIQAQTLFNLEQAQKQNLKIIGAVNKIDIAQEEQISQTKKELAKILNMSESEIFAISAKKGTNVPELLRAVIEKIPPPSRKFQSSYFGDRRDSKDDTKGGFRALIFDSRYDPFSGVIAYIRVFEGEIKKGERIYLIAQDQEGQAKEVGFFTPELRPSQNLKAGEIGFIKTGIKAPNKVRVGDTIIKMSNVKCQMSNLKPLPGYKEPKPVLFLSLYPENSDDFSNLKAALEKLKLQDPALDFQIESKMALGRGFRIGFLGSLHAEITVRRLKNEFGQELVLTSPQVVFKILTKKGEELSISSPSQWPDPSQIKETREPWAKLEIITPNSYFNQIFKTLKNFSAQLIETRSLNPQKSLLIAHAPLREIIVGNFYDKLKSATQGYASFSFQQAGFKQADLVKLDILVAGKIQEPFSKIVPREKAFSEGKKILQKLKETLPPQQFPVALQAAIGGKIIARETIKALRKDVTAPLYGGDVTRKRKLLEIQKKGKKKLKERAKISIPPKVFLEMLKSN
jgi:GTP-binding protein LepA